MARVMPSRVVQTIDELFPHAARNMPNAVLGAGGGSQYLGILERIPVMLEHSRRGAGNSCILGG
jgi:hypothetical protein